MNRRTGILRSLRTSAIAMPPAAAAIAIAVVAFGTQAVSAASAGGTTTLVSRGTHAGPPSVSGSEPSISTDGRFVTFEAADNFLLLNPGKIRQIWVRDRVTGTTSLASRADGGSGAAGDGSSGGSSISADGRFVVFDSRSTNLVAGFVPRITKCDPKQFLSPGDVFIRDLAAGTTRLLSGSKGSATKAGNSQSGDPHISADGSTVGYTTSATDLFVGQPAPANLCDNELVVTPRAVVATILVSRKGLLGAVGNTETDSIPSLSTDGSKIAFVSSSTNLVTGTPQTGQIYLRTIATGATIVVSRQDGPSGAIANNPALPPKEEVCGHPSLNGDGLVVAFSCEAAMGFGTNREQVYVRDVTANTTILASRQDGATGAPTTEDSAAAVISADGNTVAFETRSAEFGGDPTSGNNTVVVARDIAAGTSTTISRATGATGAIGNKNNSDIVVNGDGLVIAYEADSTNLTSDVLPAVESVREVYVRVVDAVVAAPTPAPPGLPKAGTTPNGGHVPAGWAALAGILGTVAIVVGLSRRRSGRPQD